MRAPDRFPVFETRRGGQYTYHGPGQRVAYAMLDLNTRGRDVRAYVEHLEAWVIATLAEFNLTAEVRPGRVGVWVPRPEKPPLPDGSPREDKIAAIGVRIRKWITFHGVAINVEPDLSHFDGIVPCGIEGHGVTSLVDLGLPVTMADLDVRAEAQFCGRVRRIGPDGAANGRGRRHHQHANRAPNWAGQVHRGRLDLRQYSSPQTATFGA